MPAWNRTAVSTALVCPADQAPVALRLDSAADDRWSPSAAGREELDLRRAQPQAVHVLSPIHGHRLALPQYVTHDSGCVRSLTIMPPSG